ncbi:MAG: AmmeMemoRadiSam system protein A [Proteobacteria bacterium]|nr:AmmeMemoRadiSam system protein A [Pseudomonadota bacterium]
MSSVNLSNRFSTSDRKALLVLARDVITVRLEGREHVVDRDALAGLMQEGACFVSLHTKAAGQAQLRGCMGSLEPYRSLVDDVVDNAKAAAFRDPRFPAVEFNELDNIDIDISVLSAAEPMQFKSEVDLLSQLRSGIDGLILEEGFHRGTFLPVVWEQLPDANEFLSHLKLKAGLPAQHWSDAIRVSRYTTESFGEQGIASSA